MRICCLQLAPELGKLEQNMQRADDLLQDVARGDLDLLVLPEMAFTGYVLNSLDHVRPYLEQTAAGPSTHWAIRTAQRLSCHVVVGYPEQSADFEVRYNSLVTVDPSGTVISNYRKTFLYYTDMTWARAGDSHFFHGHCGALGKVNMGICMDINPQEFEAPWDAYEFANHCVQNRAPLVILSMAWNSVLPADAAVAEQPDMPTLSYWLQRLTPLLSVEDDQETIVVIANRCGSDLAEGGSSHVHLSPDGKRHEAVFVGTSCVIRLRKGQVEVFDILGQGVEGLCMVDTDEEAKYQLSTKRNAENEEQ